VISRWFGSNEAVHRYNAFGDDATGDDDRLAKGEEKEPADLEVAQIISHSLASSKDASMQLVLLPHLVTLFN
jgi:hypothetical protein